MRTNLALVFLLFTLPFTGQAGEQTRDRHRGGITVVGTGEVTATPDTVEF